MAITKQKLISDIELRISGGKPSDDLALPKKQVSYWLDVIRDSMVTNFLNDMVKKGMPIPTEYLYKQTVPSVDLVLRDYDEDGKSEEVEVTLDKQVLRLYNDSGLVRILDNQFREYHKRNLDNIFWLGKLKYSQPDTDSVSYNRENDVVYISGLDMTKLEYVKMTLYYVPSYTGASISDTEPFVIDDMLLDLLLDEVEELARKEIYGSMQDLENDSEQDLGQVE